jgi:hypothetical protein
MEKDLKEADREFAPPVDCPRTGRMDGLFVSCGGGNTAAPGATPTPALGNGTPSGQSTITVTATSATTHTIPLFVMVMPNP